MTTRCLERNNIRIIVRFIQLYGSSWWMLVAWNWQYYSSINFDFQDVPFLNYDLYNYHEKFLCISTCLFFNAYMSLTCIQKFLVILIMKNFDIKIVGSIVSDVLKSDLCNNLEKFWCISPCLCFNADMSLTFNKTFLLIPIMNKILISKKKFVQMIKR